MKQALGHAFILVAVAVSLVTQSRPAAAFDFAEHSYISSESLRLALLTQQDLGRQKEALNLLATARVVLGSNLCDPLLVLTPEKNTTTCITLGDLPALAADHAGSPLLLKWRWFDPGVYELPPSFGRQVEDAARAIAKLSLTCSPPENALAKSRTTVGDFLAKIRPHTLPNPDILSPPDEVGVDSADSSYATLAANNCSHFRSPHSISRGEKLEYHGEFERGDVISGPHTKRREGSLDRFQYHLGSDPSVERSKPALHALAWYADLHAGALAFLRAAKDKSLTEHARDELRGVAVVFELFALHFIEDSSAPGHILASHAITTASRGLVHDKLNTEGLTVAIPKDGCAGLSASSRRDHFPLVEDACKRDGSLVIYGDHVMFDRNRDSAATLQVAELSVLRSLETFFSVAFAEPLAQPDKEATELAQCTVKTKQVPKDAAWSWPEHADSEDDAAFYRCAFQWWEIHEDKAQTRANSISAAWDQGHMDALLFLPTPVFTAGPGFASVDVRGFGGCKCGIESEESPSSTKIASFLLLAVYGVSRRVRRAKLARARSESCPTR